MRISDWSSDVCSSDLVVWNKPAFADDGTVERPATVTAFINGVLVQDQAVLRGETVYIGQPSYTAYDRAPIKLQEQGDQSAPHSFRNNRVREIHELDGRSPTRARGKGRRSARRR